MTLLITLRTAIAAAAVVGLAWAMAPASEAQARRPMDMQEDRMKAAFLYNLTKFVHWPASNDKTGPLTMCVFRDDAFGFVLRQTVHGKSVQGQVLAVRILLVADESRGCQMLFISAAEAQHTGELLAAASGGAVLTIGETVPFLSEGGLVRFFIEANRLRVQVNVEGAQQAGLKLSSQLLGIASQPGR